MTQSDEVFEVVSEDGVVVGRATRTECHRNPDLIHRAVHVFVFDSERRIYLQKRSAGKDIQPGRWDTSVGGHLAPGESYEEAAVREMVEELGIAGKPRFLYRYLWRTDRETEDVQTYAVETGELPRPDPLEIEEGGFFTTSQVDDLKGKGLLTPNLVEELRRLREAGVLAE